MNNKSQLRPHESDAAKGSSIQSTSQSGSSSRDPQRGRSGATKATQSSSSKGSGRPSKTEVGTSGGGPSRQTSEAQQNKGQL